MRTWILLRVGLLLLGVAAAAAGCTVNTACETTADCDPAAVCVDGHCTTAGTGASSSGNTAGTSVAGTSVAGTSVAGTSSPQASSSATSGAGTSAASSSRASTSTNVASSSSTSAGSSAGVTSAANSSSTAVLSSSAGQNTSSAATSNPSLSSSAAASSSTTGGSTSLPAPGSSSSGVGSTSAPAPSSSQASCTCVPDDTGCGQLRAGTECTNAGCRNVARDTCEGAGGLCEGLQSYQCDFYPTQCTLVQACQGTPWACAYSCGPGCDAAACGGGSFDCSRVSGYQCSNFSDQGCFASFQCPQQCNNSPQGCSCQEQYVCRNSAVTPCSTVTDAQTCAFGGCQWGCGGTPAACAGRQFTDCNGGCSWGVCQAAPGVCEAATTPSACNDAGCTWNSSLKCSAPLNCAGSGGSTCAPGCICQ